MTLVTVALSAVRLYTAQHEQKHDERIHITSQTVRADMMHTRHTESCAHDIRSNLSAHVAQPNKANSNLHTNIRCRPMRRRPCNII